MAVRFCWRRLGKTYALLLELLRHKDNPNFNAVVFRRNSSQIFTAGGLWDNANEFYQGLGITTVKSPYPIIRFPSGATIRFAHLQYDKDVYGFQGSQIALLCFDEITHFCLSKDTEVLSKDGWKNITDIKAGETVPSLNTQGEIELKKVTATPNFDYNGKLINIEQGKGISVQMTTNHKVPVLKHNTIDFVQAETFKDNVNIVLRSGEWTGGYYNSDINSYSVNGKIPRCVFGLPKAQQMLFFNSIICRYAESTSEYSYIVRVQDEQFADDIQELAFYVGYACTKYNEQDYYCLYISRADVKTVVKPCDVTEIDYSGKVYCLTVEDNHTFFIRRNGKTHWTGNSEQQFFYMLSRNRSTCGVRPYVRATCNPDADSWVARFIQWWWDEQTGYPIPERSGILRYFTRQNGEIIWGNSVDEVLKLCPAAIPQSVKSATFIASKLSDNKILMEKDPAYLGNLMAQSEIEKERLLNGNWKIRPSAGMYFKSDRFTIVDQIPCKLVSVARSWDLAASEPTPNYPNPDATAGVLMGKLENGMYIVLDVKRVQANAGDVRKLIYTTATLDKVRYKFVTVTVPQDAGQAGKEQAQSYASMLAGHNVKIIRVTGSKIVRATPYSAQVQSGNVMLLKGDWNRMYMEELESFPDVVHDDMVDASSDAFNTLQGAKNWAGLIN